MGDKSFYGEKMSKTIPPVRLYFPKEDIEEIKVSVEKILSEIRKLSDRKLILPKHSPFGNGDASKKIVNSIFKHTITKI